MTIILSYNDILFRILIPDGTHWGNIGQVVGTNNDTASVDADLAIGVLQFLGVGQH